MRPTTKYSEKSSLSGFCSRVESFFSSPKNELVRHRQFRNQAGAHLAIAVYIDGSCNSQRLHQAPGYRSPKEFERQESDASSTCL